MIIALIAYVLTLLGASNNSVAITTIPPVPMYVPYADHNEQCDCWSCFEYDAYMDGLSDFMDLFNSYEVKVAKNGRTMLRTGNGPFRFVKMG